MAITSGLESRPTQDLIHRFAECTLTDVGWRARSVERWVLTLREQIGLVHRLTVSPTSVTHDELKETLQRLRSDMREAEALSVLSAHLTGMWATLKQDVERLVDATASREDPGGPRAVDAQALFRSEK